jgi:catechol 2,3-dioxygenase-like lactoylglutathione lyase family enzyme
MDGIRGRQRGAGQEPEARQDWWGAVLDTPDPPALARFYSALLGWPAKHDDDGGWSTVHPGEGVAYLGFHRNPDYVRPVWPPQPGQQQMMLHLDFEVSDLAQAVGSAVELGATEAEFQPQDDVRVMLDPDGHPFCLYAHGDDD